GPAQASLGQQSRNPVQQHFNLQSQQELQGPVKQVTWHFPQEPQLPARQPPVQFEMPQPAAAESIAAECGENEVYVEVKRDLFGTVTLAHTPVVRTVGAVTHIECHYPRRHNVSSNALMPAWIPYASTQVAEEQLVFSLRLMADDWQSERVSNQYFLNDVINVEASVIQFYHVPLRVYVDSCVATVVPDVNAVPRYAFIEEYGCLIDAKLTGSQSHFLPQTEADRLRFRLEAFKFQQDNSGLVGDLIYFTCFMKATAASLPADAEHKACSFSGNRWTAAYGDNRVCGCCDTTCGFWEGRDLSVDRGMSRLLCLALA
ncbi:hypothetical protein P4O66_007593, partial [Electrophorus voltai]